MSSRAVRIAIADGVRTVAVWFDMPKPTALQLIERLREIYSAEAEERLSNEKLMARLPISLSTYARWKKKDTSSFDNIIEMLDRAGWLNTGADAPARRETSDGQRLRSLEAKVAELPTADDLGTAVATLQAAIDRLANAGSREAQPAKPARKRGAR